MEHHLMLSQAFSEIYADKNIFMFDNGNVIELKFTKGKVLRLLREANKLGRGELGVHHTTIGQIERGHREASDETLKTILPVLKITEIELNALVDRLNGKLKGASIETRRAICPDGDLEHEKFQVMLEEILHAPPSSGVNWAESIIGNIKSLWSSATGKPLPMEEEPKRTEKRRASGT